MPGPFGLIRDYLRQSAPKFLSAWLRRAESLPVLARRDERFYSIGVLEVAAELIQFRQLEVIARIVRVRRVVRVSPQIAEVLHQDKRPIELSAVQVQMLRDL